MYNYCITHLIAIYISKPVTKRSINFFVTNEHKNLKKNTNFITNCLLQLITQK